MEISDVKSSHDIAQIRKRIDAIDDELIHLLRQRIELSSLIIQAKPPVSVIDRKREEAIFNRYFAGLADTSTLPKTKRLVLAVLGASQLYPES